MVGVSGRGLGGNDPDPLSGADPLVQTQVTGLITPEAGGTVTVRNFTVTFAASAVGAPANVTLHVLSRDSFKDVIPGT